MSAWLLTCLWHSSEIKNRRRWRFLADRQSAMASAAAVASSRSEAFEKGRPVDRKARAVS